jgi:hypothetical protein
MRKEREKKNSMKKGISRTESVMVPNSLKAWRSESSLVFHERFLFSEVSSMDFQHGY